MKRDRWYWTYKAMMNLSIGMMGFEAGYLFPPGEEHDLSIAVYLLVCDVIMILLSLYIDRRAEP